MKNAVSMVRSVRAGVLALGLLGAGIAACTSPSVPADNVADVAVIPGLERADRSDYLTMRDGTRVALSLYFPAGAEPARRAPVILVQTRYGRAGMIRSFGAFRDDGHVIASVDTRGSTSSFGPRRVDIGPDEALDMEEIIAHLADQPWCNGFVFAQGTSYMADTADIATSRPAPALEGAVIRQLDFDVFQHLLYPGGVGNKRFLLEWGDATLAMDEGRNADGTLDCRRRVEDCDKLWPRLDAVDDDPDYVILRDALSGRDRWQPDDYSQLTYFDDKGLNGFTLFQSSPSYYLAGIREQAKPAQVWGSWMDGGTARAALSRYLSAPNVAMEVWITANDHSNKTLTDPLASGDATPRPTPDEQFAIMSGFYERIMEGEPVGRQINYFVMGADEFRSSDVWPPAGIEAAFLYLAAEGRLSEAAPATGSTRYEVDFSAGTGEATRWSAQLGVPAAYPDRRTEDQKLLVFDSDPTQMAMEIAGDPVVSLYVSTLTPDPAFHVYLEIVAPDGSVRYLTEGTLRAIHRAPADPRILPYDMGAAPHSFRRADSRPVTPGEIMHVELALNPVAARLEPGERVRVAIAGADASFFRRYSENRDEVFTIYFGPSHPSALVLPVRPWSEVRAD